MSTQVLGGALRRPAPARGLSEPWPQCFVPFHKVNAMARYLPLQSKAEIDYEQISYSLATSASQLYCSPTAAPTPLRLRALTCGRSRRIKVCLQCNDSRLAVGGPNVGIICILGSVGIYGFRTSGCNCEDSDAL